MTWGFIVAIAGVIGIIAGMLVFLRGADREEPGVAFGGALLLGIGIVAFIAGIELCAPSTPHHVTLFSGNEAVADWVSQDTPWTDEDGFSFTDRQTGRTIRVRGAVVVEPMERK